MLCSRAALRLRARPITSGHLPIFTARRTFLGLSRRRAAPRAVEDLNVSKLRQRRADYDRDRTWFLAAGAISGIIALVVLSRRLWAEIQKEQAQKDGNNINNTTASASPKKITRLDAPEPANTDTYTIDGDTRRKVIVHDEQGHEIVPTGNSTVPSFPRTLDIAFPGSSSAVPSLEATIEDRDGLEYTLVGLGLRTVSIFSIQVYVVGFYVATADIAALQARLVKQVNPVATTLVPGERDELRAALVDPSEGEKTWDALLRETPCRSAFRVIPVRDTDFHHLRDGFVRAVTARSASDKSYADEGFGAAMRDFKGIFNRGKVPKRQELLLCRDERGRLAVLYDDGKKKRQTLGVVEDERVSRLLWLNYLAGKKVASEPARRSIIDGIMEFVERPVGTVATQVVVAQVI